MKFNIFKRQKVDNASDLEGMIVSLPLAKKDVPLETIINSYDKIMNLNGYADGNHMVKLNDSEEMSVNDLVKKHMEACNTIEKMKMNAKTEEGGEPGKGADDDEKKENEEITAELDEVPGDPKRGRDKSVKRENEESEEEMEEKKKGMQNVADIKAKAMALKNAGSKKDLQNDAESPVISLSSHQMERGKKLYGSGN